MASPRQQRSDAADAVTVLLLGAGAVVGVALLTALRFLDVFREDGIAWTIDVDDVPTEATLGSGAATVGGIAENLLVIAPGVGGWAQTAIVASILLWALAVLTVISAVMFVAWRSLRGRLFAPATARAFDVIGWTIVGGALLVLVLENIGRNGVLDAIGASGAEPLHPLEFWAYAPAWIIGTAVGIVAVAFRRGIRLQRDTDGLV